MRKTKRQLPNFAFYDQKRIEAHLEKMAAQGWMLEKVGNYSWTYGRMEPKQVHVAVTYVAGASNFDSGPTEGELDLEELAARDGWVRKLSWGQMQIFYNEQPDPVPLETDPATQVENIQRAMRKNVLPRWLMMLGLDLYLAFFWIYQLRRDPVHSLAEPLYLSQVVMSLWLFAVIFWEMGGYLLWLKRARKGAERGELVSTGSRRLFSWASVLFVLVVVLLGFSGRFRMLALTCLFLLTVTLLAGPLLRWIKSWGRSRRFNLAVSIAAVLVLSFSGITLLCIYVFQHPGAFGSHSPAGQYEILPDLEVDYYQDELPLRLEDLMEIEEGIFWSTEKQEQGSFLVERMECSQHDLNGGEKRLPRLEYVLTKVKVPGLYGFCRDGLLRKHKDVVKGGEVLYVSHYEEIDAAPWGAEAAYQLYLEGGFIEQYILCYDKILVELDLDEPPTSEQIETIRNKLHLR